MSDTKLSQPRVLRTGHPLTLDQVRHAAPAVFAQEPHNSRGARYAYVPTIQPLQTLVDNGWGIYEAAQQRSRAADRDPYTKHMLRLRKLGDFTQPAGADGVPEVILINAHDGTAAYHLYAGYFRFVCCNGMMVGKKLAAFKVRHTVGPNTSQEVLAAGELTVTEKFPAMLEQVDRMKATVLETEQRLLLANHAMTLRYGSVTPPFQVQELLNCRREQDAGDAAWQVLNRIQENVMQGGWETRSTMFNRASRVRAVERVSAVAKINAGLWDMAAEMAGA